MERGRRRNLVGVLGRGDATVTLTYKLDGSDSRNMMMGPGGQPADSMSSARWDGPKLTIVTKQESAGQLTQSTEAWTMAGNTLTVEGMRTDKMRGGKRSFHLGAGAERAGSAWRGCITSRPAAPSAGR